MWRRVLYWILVVLAFLIMSTLWALQLGSVDTATAMSDAHAQDDSEGGSFMWFLFSIAIKLLFLGWHTAPIALVACALLSRGREMLLGKRLHATLFGITIVSFAVALVRVFYP